MKLCFRVSRHQDANEQNLVHFAFEFYHSGGLYAVYMQVVNEKATKLALAIAEKERKVCSNFNFKTVLYTSP